MKNTDKKRNTYAVSFVKLVDSAWKPKIEAHLFRSESLGGNVDCLRVKTSANNMHGLEQVHTKEFNNKDEFVNFMTQKATSAWDNYEAEKMFDQECINILGDIDSGIEAEPAELENVGEGSLWNYQKYYKTEFDPKLTEEEVKEKLIDIEKRDIGNGMKPYVVLKEVFGVDLLRTPDLASEEKVKEVYEKRVKADDNNGIFRREPGRRGAKQ